MSAAAASSTDRRALTTRIKREARRLGFEDVGIASLRPSDHAAFYRAWLDAGMHGEMHYLARPDAVEARLDPARRWPGLRSCIVVTLRYYGDGDGDGRGAGRGRGVGDGHRVSDGDGDVGGDPGRAVIARYALGRDYHKVLKKKLLALLAWLEGEVGRELPAARAYVDTGPVLERELARRAGIGWFGRNTMILNPRRGSYFFLGTLLTELELEPDPPFEREHCGTCNACVEACPTGALLGRDASGAPVIDARRCIAYLTIEQRGPIPRELRPLIGNRVFGCDVCQEVCPWNRHVSRDAGASRSNADILLGETKNPDVRGAARRNLPVVPELRAREPTAPALIDLMRMSYDEWDAWSRGSAVRRAGYAGLRRNIAVALGNWASPDAVPVLTEALSDDEPLVRGHAAWALAEVGSPEASAALEALAAAERDAFVLEEVEGALDRLRAKVK